MPKYFELTKIKRKIMHLLELIIVKTRVSIYYGVLKCVPVLVVYFRLTILNFISIEYTVWWVIFGRANFRGKSEKALRIKVFDKSRGVTLHKHQSILLIFIFVTCINLKLPLLLREFD